MLPHPNQLPELLSPGLVIVRERVEANLAEMIRIAGGVRRLRPHVKTHKMAAIIRRKLELGIERHKCATLREAEMLAAAGVRDIFLAYNLVGPNIARAVRLIESHPGLTFSCTADDARMTAELGRAMDRAGQRCGVVLDLDTGLGRSGLPLRDRAPAVELFRRIVDTPGLAAIGLHLYDGQNHQRDLAERRAAVLACWEGGALLRDALDRLGLAPPLRIVAGGTGSFPIYAEFDDPALEMSPGTVVLHDAGYARQFPDLAFTPAALLLTRVVSRPAADRITCDLGTKAVAPDGPPGQRVDFPDLPEAEAILHNEEHLVLRTPRAGEFAPGDPLWAIPRHVCPTVALHRAAMIVAAGRIVDEWEVTARDR